MGVIATLLPNAGQLQRLRIAVRERHTVVECHDWSGVSRTCEAQPVHLVVMDLYADGTANFDAVRRLQVNYPRMSIVAYVSFSPDRARDLFDAGRCGLDGLVLTDRDDAPRTLLNLVDQAENRSVAGTVRSSLAEAPPLLRDALLLGITRAHERLTPASLARILCVSRRLLAQRLAEYRFPAPQRLLTWARLVAAAHMLEDAGRSADRIALALDFPSGSAFRNTCQRYLHATPSQIRARGGAPYVINALLRQTKLGRGAAAGHRSVSRTPNLVV